MPRIVYKLRDGSRIPSVTTILSGFKDAGGLIHWAWQQGVDGKDYRETRDDAATAGTIAHEMIDKAIHGHTWLPETEAGEEIMANARRAFAGFESWRESVRLEIVCTEISLVSEEHRFGGTPDAIGIVGGELVIVDWKTSKRIYGDYLAQVAAYRHLWEFGHPNEDETVPRLGEPIRGLHLLRIDKEWGSFSHYSWPVEVLDEGWRYFEALRCAYDSRAILKRAAGG